MRQVKGKNPHIFGVRHLSPAGAYHLTKFLDKIKPTAVLVEGLSDANCELEHFTAPGTKLPIAVLAYTEKLPVRTLFYPIAEYSPEYQGIKWAHKHSAHVEFIDLPSEVFFEIEEFGRQKPDEGKDENAAEKEPTKSVYQKLAELAGETDYDTYWERCFEHNLNYDAYRLTAYQLGQSLRELSTDSRQEYARNLIREAYMRRQIKKTIESGHDPDKIVVITGAYHASVLNLDYPAMTDEQWLQLPKAKSKLTLMPYSFYRLSSKSGYGAGNNAPHYFQLMWKCLKKGEFSRLPAEYLANIAEYMRKSGTPKSSAEVIEGVRLANTLAGLNGGNALALKDLRDAAITCLGQGEIAVVAEAVAAVEVEVGTMIGSLPEGVSRTSIQDDFYYELKRLKLDKYRSVVAAELELDLRENRRVKSKEAAYLDLHRSFFLHRLKVLKVCFQKLQQNNNKGGWSESWVLQWTPEAEIELVEAALIGETVELAAAYVFKDRLENCEKISAAAQIIREACECGMPADMEHAGIVLQRVAVDTGAFEEAAQAAYEVALVISYGDIRRINIAHLTPLLQQLFLRGTLLLPAASGCDNTAANNVLEAINKLNLIALEQHAIVDERYGWRLWLSWLNVMLKIPGFQALPVHCC